MSKIITKMKIDITMDNNRKQVLKGIIWMAVFALAWVALAFVFTGGQLFTEEMFNSERWVWIIPTTIITGVIAYFTITKYINKK